MTKQRDLCTLIVRLAVSEQREGSEPLKTSTELGVSPCPQLGLAMTSKCWRDV